MSVRAATFLFSAALVMSSSAYMIGWNAALESGPRLIAHDCAGAGGDLWASEESDFPTRCKMIESAHE
jgi:hypothetical protein